ncbi:MAG TPA: hypothetical protein VF002_03780 [Gaiellaceae bacterium]
MSELLDGRLQPRIRALVAEEPGDWSEVRRRASGHASVRSRRLVLALAALLLVLLLAVPAFGLGQQLLGLFSVRTRAQLVPALPGQTVAVPYIVDRTLVEPGRGRRRLAAPLRAPLLGQDGPLAVSSPDRRWIAYESWQGGAPRVRLYDLFADRDTPLAGGTQSAVWRQDGALAYWQAAGPRSKRRPYLGVVLVRSRPTGRPTTWLGRPGPYLLAGWARSRLLVIVERCPGCPRAASPGVLALGPPGAVHRLPLTDVSAISPDGRYVLGGFNPVPEEDGPSPLVRLVEVSTGRIVQTLDLRQAGSGGIEARWLAGGIGPGSWLGARIVATTALGNGGALVVLTFSGGRLSLEQVIRLGGAPGASTGYGPFFSAPLFVDGGTGRVAVALSVPPSRGRAGRRSLLECDLSRASCVGGRALARGSWLALVGDPVQPGP